MPPHCTFRILNGCIWERKGAFGNGEANKRAKRKIGEHPVLFLWFKRYTLNEKGPQRAKRQICEHPVLL